MPGESTTLLARRCFVAHRDNGQGRQAQAADGLSVIPRGSLRFRLKALHPESCPRVASYQIQCGTGPNFLDEVADRYRHKGAAGLVRHKNVARPEPMAVLDHENLALLRGVISR